MLALTVTLLTAIYILGPDLISRFILGFVVPRRAIQQTRSEEITRALLTAIFPFCLALLWVRLRDVVIWSSIKGDVQVYLSGILSQRLLDANPAQFFQSAKVVARACWSLAWRLYVVLIAYAVVIDILIFYYGEIRNSNWMSKRPSARKVLATFVLPRISEWHILLRSFSHKRSADIRADVLTRGNILYRGTIQDLLLAPDGSLSGLLLSRPLRYQREKYLEDCGSHAQNPQSVNPSPENYWKRIPGHGFLIMSDDITTINLRTYEPETDLELFNRLREILNVALTSVAKETGTSKTQD